MMSYTNTQIESNLAHTLSRQYHLYFVPTPKAKRDTPHHCTANNIFVSSVSIPSAIERRGKDEPSTCCRCIHHITMHRDQLSLSPEHQSKEDTSPFCTVPSTVQDIIRARDTPSFCTVYTKQHLSYLLSLFPKPKRRERERDISFLYTKQHLLSCLVFIPNTRVKGKGTKTSPFCRVYTKQHLLSLFPTPERKERERDISFLYTKQHLLSLFPTPE